MGCRAVAELRHWLWPPDVEWLLQTLPVKLPLVIFSMKPIEVCQYFNKSLRVWTKNHQLTILVTLKFGMLYRKYISNYS